MDVIEFWRYVLEQDADRLREFFCEDAYVNWHCTNEHFNVNEYIRANCEYPGEWTGELGGKELDRLIKEFLQKKDCPVRKITMLEKAVCVFPSEKELPDYTKTLAKREKIYQFIGVYTGGQQDENGRLLCEYWEVAIG